MDPVSIRKIIGSFLLQVKPRLEKYTPGFNWSFVNQCLEHGKTVEEIHLSKTQFLSLGFLSHSYSINSWSRKLRYRGVGLIKDFRRVKLKENNAWWKYELAVLDPFNSENHYKFLNVKGISKSFGIKLVEMYC